ncbi:MAG: signal peptidase II [Candidatus Melainabacteria bacterium]|jgi:signal peptidase II
MIKKKNFLIWFSFVSFLVFLDQLTKLWSRNNLEVGKSVEIIPSILNWNLAFNNGAAFSFMAGQIQFLSIVSLLVSAGLIIYTFKKIDSLRKIYLISLAFLAAGSIGNFIDRAYFKQVTDFIDLLILPGNFPIFNVADTWINVAVFLLIIDSFKTLTKSKDSEKNNLSI